jgi:hypothetical protein
MPNTSPAQKKFKYNLGITPKSKKLIGPNNQQLIDSI